MSSFVAALNVQARGLIVTFVEAFSVRVVRFCLDMFRPLTLSLVRC